MPARIPLNDGTSIVVGDGGQMLRREGASEEWSAIDVGISEDLIDIVAERDSAWVLAIASNRMLYSSDAGLTWIELAAGKAPKEYIANLEKKLK